MKRGWLALVCVAGGCISEDTTALRPIQPWPESQRVWVDVDEMKNEAPSPEGAAITVEATAMLRTLLARSERFLVATDPAAPVRYRIATTLIEFHDVDAQETIVFEKAQSFGRKRRAVVEIHYRLIGLGGLDLASRVARGSVLCDTERPLDLPTPTSLTTGAYWHSEFGRATRDCLDQLVRDVCVHVGPESATAPENQNPSNLGA
ncbi:MAG: hypothetical protein IPH13_08360 [Planctomycetes bacterium]|nr:hypothetical protein [Planctomycetota bacterium]MCC7169729.1 hypothetical protein [Planctomycetota bacterium]